MTPCSLLDQPETLHIFKICSNTLISFLTGLCITYLQGLLAQITPTKAPRIPVIWFIQHHSLWISLCTISWLVEDKLLHIILNTTGFPDSPCYTLKHNMTWYSW
jgi:hypothetical protein